MRPERLLVGVIGNRNAGKTHTWNTLFGSVVRTGTRSRHLILRPGEAVEVFLISGSPEERERPVEDIIGDQNSRIVLCSMQYVEGVERTLNHFIDNGFSLFIQWPNPGRSDRHAIDDHLSLMNPLLETRRSVVSIRDGRINADRRVNEMREFIYGWALYRDLIINVPFAATA